MGYKENILIVGGVGFGGREHVTTAAFLRSENVAKVYVAPGNDALFHPHRLDDRVVRIPHRLDKQMNEQKMLELAAYAEELHALVFVGPENPLSQGIVDIFTARGIPIIGPTRKAARLEASKSWAKDVMASLNIPIPRYAYFDYPDPAKDHIQFCGYQVVVKADG